MTTGDKIKLLRKSKGMTQSELGERLGVKKNAVSKWECGRVEDIPAGKIKMMAEIFEVPTSYLIDDEETIKKQPADASNADELDLAILSLVKQLPAEQKRFLLAQLRGVTGEK